MAATAAVAPPALAVAHDPRFCPASPFTHLRSSHGAFHLSPLAKLDSALDKPPKRRLDSRGKPEAEYIVIGSGIGGLCCGGLLARYGEDVLVLESHDVPGGAAHSFEIKGYHFDSGPSLFSGLSSRGPQANPLAQVLDALDEKVECARYDSWMVYLPEGDFLTRIGPSDFFKDLAKYAGPTAVAEWKTLLDGILPLSGASMSIPPAAIRGDLGVLRTAGIRFVPAVLKMLSQMSPQDVFRTTKLLQPFSVIMDSLELKDPFIRNWMDLLCFLLSGLKADGTLSAEIIYMFAEWYKPGCVLEYPIGGVGTIVNALVQGLQKYGGNLMLNAHVKEIVIDGGHAVGVKLRDGNFIKARKAVISNASIWDTMNLIRENDIPAEYRVKSLNTPQCDSFMHLHLGIDGADLPADLEIHHIIVNDWKVGVDAPQNVVLISIPSVLDPSLAPEGKHVLHAYTPATEPYSLWEGLDRRSKEYKQLKEERSQALWAAVSRAIGPTFSREKCEVEMVGTPLTHERFLRRNRGTYGPAIQAGKGTFPGSSTPIPRLFCCGDSTFPGIGIPAAAASGLIAANSLISVGEHTKLLEALGI